MSRAQSAGPVSNELQMHAHPGSEAKIKTSVSMPITRTDGRTFPAQMLSFTGLSDSQEHILLRFSGNTPTKKAAPLVRVHSECLTGDTFQSARCDCGAQLSEAIDRVSDVGGAIVYLRQEGRGIGLYNKLDAYALQERGVDTYEANETLGFPADSRNYLPAAQMLKAAGLHKIDLLTNNTDKAEQLVHYGIDVAHIQHTQTHLTPTNAQYLATKAVKTGHALVIESRDLQ